MAYDPEARQTSNMALVVGIIVLVLIVGGAIAYMASRPSPVETDAPTIIHDQTPAPPQVVPVPVPDATPAPDVIITPPDSHSSTTTTTTIEKTETAPSSSDSGSIDSSESSESSEGSTSSSTTTTTTPSGY